MGKALLERVPDSVLFKIVGDLLEKIDVKQLSKSRHWSSLISNKELFLALVQFYFPDNKQFFVQLQDKLDEDCCEDILKHGVPFRYGHLEGVQEQYLMALLMQDHATQEQLLSEHSYECVTMCYVDERGE